MVYKMAHSSSDCGARSLKKPFQFKNGMLINTYPKISIYNFSLDSNIILYLLTLNNQ